LVVVIKKNSAPKPCYQNLYHDFCFSAGASGSSLVFSQLFSWITACKEKACLVEFYGKNKMQAGLWTWIA